ncbi:MAG: hypothetical protein J5959_03615, partial [Butyrivibrio sp.]|nr:hypothetical protein [Butyrivibrio sp.]
MTWKRLQDSLMIDMDPFLVYPKTRIKRTGRDMSRPFYVNAAYSDVTVFIKSFNALFCKFFAL